MVHSSISRKHIIKTIVNVLKPLDFVRALWEGGAAAFGRVDKWSDIDIMVVSRDDAINKVFRAVESAFKKVSEIEFSYKVPESVSGGFSQKFYKLEGTDKFLLIDFAVAKKSKKDKYLEKEIHGKAVIHFDKDNITSVKPIDKRFFQKNLETILDSIIIRFETFNEFFVKDFNRKHYIEAIDFYNNFILGSLVNLLRIKHSPFHYNFRTKYTYYDFPPKITRKLESLYFVKDKGNLLKKYVLAKKWFYSLAKELRQSN